MARLPKDAAQAVDSLGVRAGSSVVAVGPDHGFLEALGEAVGKEGKLVVQAPPPDVDVPKGVEVVDEVPADASVDAVVAWTTVVPVHAARELGDRVKEDGVMWLVLPKGDRESRAAVTEGDVKRAMLSAGWREERVQQLSKSSFAVRFRRRR